MIHSLTLLFGLLVSPVFLLTYSKVNMKTLLWRVLLKDCWFISHSYQMQYFNSKFFFFKCASLSCFQRFYKNISLLLAISIDRRHCSNCFCLLWYTRDPSCLWNFIDSLVNFVKFSLILRLLSSLKCLEGSSGTTISLLCWISIRVFMSEYMKSDKLERGHHILLTNGHVFIIMMNLKEGSCQLSKQLILPNSGNFQLTDGKH